MAGRRALTICRLAEHVAVRSDEVSLRGLAGLGLVADLAEPLVGQRVLPEDQHGDEAAAMAGMRPIVTRMATIADSGWTGLGTAAVADR